MNALLYGLRSLMVLLFPLITFPYASRVLGVDNMGKVSFSANVVSYFLLIAQFGIFSYASREGSRIRDDKEKMNAFASSMFTINLLSSLVAYLLLAIAVMVVSKFQLYTLLIVIQSINIIGTTIGVEWICNIYEDYGYIAIRTLLVQIVTLAMLFGLVKTPNDYVIYAAISVLANTGANVMNFFHIRKYVDLRITKELHLDCYLKPIMIIFFSAIATTIYVNADITMIGFMWGDYYNGLYHASVRIYSMLQTLLASIFLVALPRLSNELANHEQDSYQKNLNDLFDELMFFLLPVAIGLFMVSNQAVQIFAGKAYADAGLSLRILSITLIFSLVASYLTNTMLLPMGKENRVLQATVICAIANILLNLFWIPELAQNGAAFTTLIAELLMVLIQLRYVPIKKYLKIKEYKLVSVLTGCIAIVACCKIVDTFTMTMVQATVVKVVVSALLYIVILTVMKNTVMKSVFRKLLSRFHRNEGVTE